MASGEMPPLLSVRGLSIGHATSAGFVRVLDDVAIEQRTASTLGVVGESGSGKSTLGLAVLGLLPKSARIESGSITFEGRDLVPLTTAQRRALRGRRIAMVFQDPFTSLNPALTIERQIAETLMFHHGSSRGAARARALELLGEVRIPRAQSIMQAYPHELSGGMKQRVIIAAAIACKPSLLILDEPTTALDVTTEAQILDLLRTLRAEHDLSMMFISHNLHLVAGFCDDICVLYSGTVVERGPTKAVLDSPIHPYTKGLIAAVPTLAQRRRRLSTIPGKLPTPDDRGDGCIFAPRCPFAEDSCASAQPLAPVREARAARCWKANAMAHMTWPTPAGEPAGRAAADPASDGQSILLETAELRKVFGSERLLSKLGDRLRSFGLSVAPPAAVRALDGVTLTLNRGEVLGILGESGSGKTTLARCIVKLVDPTSGSIRYHGGDAAGKATGASRPPPQMVFQNPASSLNPRKTVGDIIGRSLVLAGHGDARQRAARVRELLALVQLPAAYAGRYPAQLSGGERQRVGIARALSASPELIVCDEAVSALDVSVQAAVINLLSDLRDRLRIAYLFISHDVSVVAHLADRIAVMRDGKIVEAGITEQVLEAPRHPYTIALIAAARRGQIGTSAAPEPAAINRMG